MPADISSNPDVLAQQVKYVAETVTRIESLLKEQNGRLRAVENKQAGCNPPDIEKRLGAVEMEQARQSERMTTASRLQGALTLVSAAIAAWLGTR